MLEDDNKDEDFVVPLTISVGYSTLSLVDLTLDYDGNHTARYEDTPSRIGFTIYFNSKETFERMLRIAGASVFNAEANANVTAGMWRDGQHGLWECR